MDEEARKTYPTPEHGWVCFHCGEHFEPTFAGQRRAQQHFGPYPTSAPSCSFEDKPALIRRLRQAEHEAQTMFTQKTALERELAALRPTLQPKAREE